VPWLAENIDYAVFGILALSVIPIAWEWWRHRQHENAGAPS
jgi:membrane-associated protein